MTDILRQPNNTTIKAILSVMSLIILTFWSEWSAGHGMKSHVKGRSHRVKTETRITKTGQSFARASEAELKKLGKTVDLTAHLGFLTTWWVIGPFDNTDKEGFAVVYPPERNVDRNATYQGKQRKVAWKKYETKEKYGFVDLNKAIAKHMGATAYAMTEFYAPAGVDAQIRLATFNANMIWLNGQRVDAETSASDCLANDLSGRGHCDRTGIDHCAESKCLHCAD